MIQIVGNPLNQWDVGRLVQVTGEASHVHFANQGDSAAVIIDIVDGEAKIPDYLLQTGKTLFAYSVLNGVTLERVSFAVRKRERPENYVYDDDRRNYIYELISDAQAATASANQAAQDILAAKERGEFNGPKGDPLLIIDKASGTEITMSDAEKHAFIDMHIFGKTTQDGVPTPDAPVELVSVGDSGSITVNVTGDNESQSVTVATPNGLPGIPVASGGNYTDANGQQWICDEIDLARGVRIKRIEGIVFDGSSDEIWDEYGTAEDRCFRVWMSETFKGTGLSLCDMFENVESAWVPLYASQTGVYSDHATALAKYFRPPNDSIKTLSQWLTWLDDNHMTMVYVLATPIETQLSEEEIAAYAAIHTYRDHTTVSNDTGAWMDLEYVMDAKKYIDSLVTGGIIPATVE